MFLHLRGLRGEHGGWIDFLAFCNQRALTPSSISMVSRDVLVAFLTTFKKKEDLKALQCRANSLLFEKLKQVTTENNTPEQMLIRLTMNHPEFSSDYSFPSLSNDWLVSDIGMKSSTVMKSTDMIAVDCEMVLREDGTEGLVRVGAVDRHGKVILDKFVKPAKPIVDYRTAITGLTAHDIEKATLTVVDIQVYIVVSINDIFSYFMKILNLIVQRELQHYLSDAIFCKEVRKEGVSHNCVHDAAASMNIALAFIKKPFDTTVAPSKEMLEAEKSRLFIHRIPSYVPSEKLNLVLAGEFHSTKFKLDVKPAKTQGGNYCALVVFDSSKEADQAFENVNGYKKRDSFGLPQKLSSLKLNSGLSASYYVRKMV
ncbi:hypothetical protein Bca52824_087475 [Brassica carinata]|uniref:Exonuclease domain-containing protein n=1 Tax=Brassica carinata TaxID=52824 RepID=A0A8X7TN05_BRACI|nr:hypothetical protein Bca52824_087475 [Brassica carinata]